MKSIARLALGACLVVQTLICGAQNAYPSEPIKLIVPFPAGGTLDGLARMLQPKLSELLGQSIIIENINGASGRIGTAKVVRSKPDGYTMLMMYDTLPIDPILFKASLPYNPLTDLAPVSLITRAPLIAIGSLDIPPTNMAELVAYAKQNPSKINYGSTGTGSSSHLSGALFARTTDTQMTHIPFSGGAPMMAALIGGHVNLSLSVSALQQAIPGPALLDRSSYEAVSRSSYAQPLAIDGHLNLSVFWEPSNGAQNNRLEVASNLGPTSAF